MVTQGQKSCRLGRQRELLPGEASRRAAAEEPRRPGQPPGRPGEGPAGEGAKPSERLAALPRPAGPRLFPSSLVLVPCCAP